jgi:hypothetical protein
MPSQRWRLETTHGGDVRSQCWVSVVSECQRRSHSLGRDDSNQWLVAARLDDGGTLLPGWGRDDDRRGPHPLYR